MEEKITLEKIDKLSKLSMLYFDRSEKLKMQKEVNGIVEMLDKCADFNITSEPKQRKNKYKDLREDECISGLDIDTVFLGVESRQQDFFAVDKVVDYETK